MPSSASCCTWESSRRSARMPACTFGCSVLTRPSRHSGKPVRSSTLVTGRPSDCDPGGGSAGRDELDAGGGRPRASSSSPVLSYTETRARLIGMRSFTGSLLRSSSRVRAPRRSMLGDVTPWWLPTCASRVPHDNGSAASPTETHHPAVDGEALAGDPADGVDQHRPLDDLDPLVQRLDGVVVQRPAPPTCATIGPVSTPASTTKSVQPVTFTPYASASRGPVHARERRRQRRVGVDEAPAERRQERRPDQLHEARRDDQVGLGAPRPRR